MSDEEEVDEVEEALYAVDNPAVCAVRHGCDCASVLAEALRESREREIYLTFRAEKAEAELKRLKFENLTRANTIGLQEAENKRLREALVKDDHDLDDVPYTNDVEHDPDRCGTCQDQKEALNPNPKEGA